MKLKYCLIAVALSVSVIGCNRDKQIVNSPDSGQETQALKDSAIQTKDAFLAVMDKKMKELDAKIAQLTSKSADYKDDAKVQADKALAELHTQRDTVGQKYAELKNAGHDAWDKTKAAFNSAWGNLEKTYDKARDKFN